MAITINGTTGIAGVDGSAGTPALQGADTNTGIFFPAADTIAFAEGGVEAARFDSSGNLGIGTATPVSRLTIAGASAVLSLVDTDRSVNTYGAVWADQAGNLFLNADYDGTAGGGIISFRSNGSAVANEKMRIDTSGRVLVGTTSTNLCAGNTEGIGLNTTSNGTLAIGTAQFSASGNAALAINRKTDDGGLVTFSQDGTQEGSISVSGTTVSYNGGHLSRWAQTTAPKDDTLVKGTVLSNLDEMNVYTDADGNLVENEQLNKVKVSDIEGDANVAGVFVNWTHDEQHNVDEINMAMTGDMIIHIAQGTAIQRGDLLMSAGNGTAKPQGDDIVRSKTIAKVTSTHVTCTYADGSYCVPCVLMAC